jgi:hypothetical protein
MYLADSGLWQETYDRYNNEINYASIVENIDFGTASLGSEQESFSVTWSGMYCYSQSFPSDSMGLRVRVSSPSDIVSFKSSAISSSVQFSFTSQNLENSTFVLLTGMTGLYPKIICGGLQVVYKHKEGAAGCSVRFGDVQTFFQTTALYPIQNHVNGSPFNIEVLPGMVTSTL